MFHRQTVFFVACALPLLFAPQLAPNMARELDFWVMWLVAMALIGLPILFAEFALSVRSAQMPWQGMQKLTREADSSVAWRIFAGLSVVLCVMIAASITSRVAVGLATYMPELHQALAVPTFGMSVALMVVVLILSLLKSRLLPIALLLILAGSLIALFDGGLTSGVSVPVMTDMTLGEWGRAVLLALLSVGVGTGLYWFGSVGITAQLGQLNKSMSGMIVPIWLTQLIFGALALLAGSAMITPISFAVAGAGMLGVAAFLLFYAGSQLMSRFGVMIGGTVLLVLGVVFGLLPSGVLTILLSVLGVVTVLVLAVFVGFVMKISHLRKALNFGNETRYNIWRILVRIVVPIALVMAMIGLVAEWLV